MTLLDEARRIADEVLFPAAAESTGRRWSRPSSAELLAAAALLDRLAGLG